jgi:hypothetical protein
MDLTTNEITTWLNTTSQPLDFATDGINLYFSRTSANIIYKIPLSPNPTNSLNSYQWSTDLQLNNPSGFEIISNNLYVSNRNNGTISEINLTTGVANGPAWITGLFSPTRMKIYNNFLYVINSYGTSGPNLQMNNTVSQISLTNKSITTLIASSFLFSPFALTIYNDYLYVTNNNIIDGFYNTKKINLTGPPKITSAVSSNLQSPAGIFSYNNSIYIESSLFTTGSNRINIYKEVSSTIPIPTNISYNSTTKLLSWRGVAFDSTNNYFMIQDLTNNLNLTSNSETIDLTQFMTQNPTITLFNITIRQVNSNIIGPESNSYRINLATTLNFSYNSNTKVLTWSSTRVPYDYFIIRDSSKGLDVTSNTTSLDLTSFISQNSSVTTLNVIVRQVNSGAIGPESITYTINLPQPTPPPSNLSYNTNTKVLTWSATLPYESFMIEESSRALFIGNSNTTSFNLTQFISQNSSFTTLNITVRQVNSGIPGAQSITYTINLPPPIPPTPTNLSYNTQTKTLTWSATGQYDSFIIRDLSKGLDVSSNNTSFNLTSFISQNPSVTTLNVGIRQVKSGVIGLESNIYTFDLPSPPTDISYNRTTKLLTWSAREPYQSFFIEDLSTTFIVGNSNTTSFDLTQFISQNSSFKIFNIRITQLNSGIPGEPSNIYEINLLPLPSDLSYNRTTNVLSWTATEEYEYFTIRDLSNNLDTSRNEQNIDLSTFISEKNPLFFNITIKQITSGLAGPGSNIIINLVPPPIDLSYNTTTKVLTWSGKSPYDYFTIRDLSNNLDISRNVQNIDLSTFISEKNPLFFNIRVTQTSSGFTGPESNVYTINLVPAPIDLSYNTTTKVLTWLGKSPYDYFTIRDLSNNLDISRNAQNIDLSTFISENNPLFLNVKVTQTSSGFTGPGSNIIINLVPVPMNIKFNSNTKVLRWTGLAPYDYFTIYDSLTGNDISTNNTFISLKPLIFQNSTSLHITIRQTSSGITGPLSKLFIINLLPQSNICFTEGTIIQTDQGEIPIELISHTNTINNLKVMEVTKTTSFDDYLICIEKDCLDKNYPNQKTIVSQNHKILFKEQLTKAKDLPNTTKISYNGEILYNILLEQNHFMIANNLICETLDVDNVIAHLYKSPNKIKITHLLNNANTFEEYKQIALTNLTNLSDSHI